MLDNGTTLRVEAYSKSIRGGSLKWHGTHQDHPKCEHNLKSPAKFSAQAALEPFIDNPKLRKAFGAKLPGFYSNPIWIGAGPLLRQIPQVHRWSVGGADK